MTKSNMTAAAIAKATFTAEQAGEYLALAARAAIEGKAKVDEGKARGAAALAVMTAGFAADDTAARKWTFDLHGNDGAVHSHVRCTGTDEYGNDNLDWKRNAEGAVSKVAQTAYKTALQNTFFNLPESNAAVWTMASKAIPMARAIREENMTARIEKGALVLEGGTGDRAEAMRAAKSLSALAKVAAGNTGTNRAAPGNAKGESARRRVKRHCPDRHCPTPARSRRWSPPTPMPSRRIDRTGPGFPPARSLRDSSMIVGRGGRPVTLLG
jgi:hypothetical protein